MSELWSIGQKRTIRSLRRRASRELCEAVQFLTQSAIESALLLELLVFPGMP